MTVERVQESVARRSSRAAFAAAAAVALYTAAGFGALLYAGLGAAEACVVAAAVGVIVAFVAARVVQNNEARIARQRIADAQITGARVAAPPPPAAEPQPESAAREIRASREIQTALLPREVPFVEGYHLEIDYQPCGALGGDFYDFRCYDDSRLLLTLGDVSGKGPAGAIVMAMVQTLFRENASAAAGPADLLHRVNEGFAGTLGKGVFVTALCGLLDPERHRLTLAGAGHHPVLLMNPDERRSTRVGTRGLALGLMSGDSFLNSLVETSIDLAPGDTLLLYTDGATESVEDLKHDVGENRFHAAAAAAILPGPHGALERLRTDLWSAGGRRDDTTMMLVSRVGSATESRARSARSARDLTV